MSTRLVLGALPLLLLPSAPLAAQVTPDQLMRHIRVLASDEYEGRKPGTAGGERTEAYVLEAFAAAGLKPGAAGGSWRQPVTLVERRPQSSTYTFRGGGGAVPMPGDSLVLIGRQDRVNVENGPILFGGHGTADDLQGVDVRGAVVLFLSGTGPGEASKGALADRLAALARAGATAAIPIVPASTSWEQVKQAMQVSAAARRDGVAPVEGAITREGASALLRASGQDLDALVEEAERPEFLARSIGATATLDVRTQVRQTESANIIGKIDGSSRTGESVVLMAHWDHLGFCAPEGAPDRICNGAVDNASGTAILIEAARAVASGKRPERNVYFVATTSEELGLHGAFQFADALPPGIGRIVAALNIDTTATGNAGYPVAIIGRGEYPALERAVDATSRATGRKVDQDTEANVMIQRQDEWALASRGIPSIMATGSVSDMNVLKAYLAGPYHSPTDDISRIELRGAAEDTDLHIALARALADPERYPTP